MMKKLMSELGKNKKGATAIEYALLASMVAVAAIGGLTAFSDSFLGMSDNTVTTIEDAINRD
ncbi:Flp family type IVb pilin [Emcibacter sp.]|uniref:Flp family type IVb pilin n=1 Tax=Emcibacter sp. TaxID=1979954 RepID=UPI003A9002E5